MTDRPNDLTGKRYGSLVVLAEAGKRGRNRMWECRCDCGAHKAIVAVNLTTGRTKSCGCSRRKPLSTPRATMPRPRVRPWLMLTDAERAILQQRIDKMMIYAVTKQERVRA